MWNSASRTLRGLPTKCAALLLAAVALPPVSGAAGGLVPQHSEDLRLRLSSKGSSATLEFAAFGRDFRLRLSHNPRLAQVAAGSSVSLYQGTVENMPGSWARISMVDGLPRGMVWDGHELFIVDMAEQGVNYGAAGTVMYKLSDAVLERGVSFAGDTVEAPRDPAAAYGAMVGELRSKTQALQSGTAADAVEVSVLGDAAFRARYASETQARDALLVRLNNVDGIFSSQVGVALQVVSVDIGGEHTDGLSATTDSSDLLQELGRLRQDSPALAATGLTHLFTGRSLDGETAGVAYTLSLCSRRYAASLAMAHDGAAIDSLITAHEIGHVFGAPHDGTEQCSSTPQNQFIMTPMISTSVTSFSQCSLDEINAVIESYSCVAPLRSTDPPTPEPPATAPDVDDDGGGGWLDPFLLLFLLALGAARGGVTRHLAG